METRRLTETVGFEIDDFDRFINNETKEALEVHLGEGILFCHLGKETTILDLGKIIAELKRESEKIHRAITALL